MNHFLISVRVKDRAYPSIRVSFDVHLLPCPVFVGELVCLSLADATSPGSTCTPYRGTAELVFQELLKFHLNIRMSRFILTLAEFTFKNTEYVNIYFQSTFANSFYLYVFKKEQNIN